MKSTGSCEAQNSANERPRGLADWRWPAALLAVGVFAFSIAAFVSWLLPFVPRVHDEFSNLLAADTLLHGRLSNATPEVWQPFQSFHIIVEPAYASKYPLGLALLVAAGWAMLGSPIAGCWLAAGICATSISWMLAGVTSRRWAVLGGLLIACYPSLQIAWSQNLMSGWLPAAGSALLLGGILRLRRRHSHWAAGMCGVGIALLAVTRPFEGLVATASLSVVCWGLWRGRSLTAKFCSIARAIPAAAIPIAASLILICLQNLATTGRVSQMPYQLHEEQYAVTPVFIFGQPHVPTQEVAGELSDTMRAFHYGWALDGFRERMGLAGWLSGIFEAMRTLLDGVKLLILLPLLTIVWWGGFRLARWLTGAIAVQMLMSASVCWIFLHYLAPLVPWLVVLAVLGLRRVFRLFTQARWVRVSRPQRFVGGMLIAQCFLLAMHCMWADDSQAAWAERRVDIIRDLGEHPGQHLVLVHYADDHNVHQEWVYNLADLDGAKVLWARGESADWNSRLIAKYQATHTLWELEADNVDPRPTLVSAGRAAMLTGLSRQSGQKVK